MATEYLDYDPCLSAEQEEDSELKYAHEQVNKAMFSGVDSLVYWTHETRNQRDPHPLPTPSPTVKCEFSDEDFHEGFDEEFLEEQRQFLAEFEAAKLKRRCPTASSSSPKERKRPRAPPELSRSRRSSDIRGHFRPSTTKDEDEKDANYSATKRPKIDEDDCIAGELSDSNDMVRCLIGPEKEEYLIPMAQLEKRPYFSDPKIGCIHNDKSGKPRMDHPSLETFDPEDFRLIAQFLESESFGVQVIDDDNRDMAFAQCAAAWEIGDRMGMEDLLEHVADKVQNTLPWAFEETLALVGIVYMTEGTPLGGHKKMKETLAQYISSNFYDMVRSLGSVFTDRVQEFPELELAIHMKLAENARLKLRMH